MASGCWTASEDYTARIWDAENGPLLRTLRGHTNWVRSAVFSEDGQRVLTASYDDNARIWDAESGALLRTLEGHTVNSAIFSLEGNYVVTTSDDGSTILWDATTGKQLIRQFIFDGDSNKWVHLHPSGAFDASDEAMELMYWTYGLEIIEFEQLRYAYFKPGLWKRVVQDGENFDDLPSPKDLAKYLPPKVIVEKGYKDGLITFQLTKRQGDWGPVAIFLNGKEIEADARKLSSNWNEAAETNTIHYQVDPLKLKSGNNDIKVRAASKDKVIIGKELGTSLTNSSNTKSAVPNLYAVLVGVEDYGAPELELRFPEEDATVLHDYLSVLYKNLYPDSKIVLDTLTTAAKQKLSKKVIKERFTRLYETITPNDILLVYFSGHGTSIKAPDKNRSDYYFLTEEAQGISPEFYIRNPSHFDYVISSEELLEWIRPINTQKSILIFDSCGPERPWILPWMH